MSYIPHMYAYVCITRCCAATRGIVWKSLVDYKMLCKFELFVIITLRIFLCVSCPMKEPKAKFYYLCIVYLETLSLRAGRSKGQGKWNNRKKGKTNTKMCFELATTMRYSWLASPEPSWTHTEVPIRTILRESKGGVFYLSVSVSNSSRGAPWEHWLLCIWGLHPPIGGWHH